MRTQLVLLLLVLGASCGYGQAKAPALAPWRVVQGTAVLTQEPGQPIIAKMTKAESSQVVSSPFPVSGDTIYRVVYHLRRQPDLRVYPSIQEVEDEKASVRHSLAFAPGYPPIPPLYMDLVAYFATTRKATQARVYLEIHPGTLLPAGEVSVELVSLSPVGRVSYLPTESANYVSNGNCERADENGIATEYGRWGGAPEARIVPGVGIGGSSALGLRGNYMLSCGEVPVRQGRRYRISGYFKGTGIVSFELRGYTSYHYCMFSGTISERYTAHPDNWQQFSLETVALPQQHRFIAMVFTSASTDTPIMVDNISVVEVGQPY